MQALDLKIKEGMLIALARRYAEGNPNDFDAAYAGLEQALEVAARDRERGKLPSNTDDEVNAVIARVDALNDDGKIDTAAAVLAEEEARAQAGLVRLYDKGIAQAILTRNVETAVSYELKKLPLELETPSIDDSYTYLRGVFIEWFTRGRQKGLNFDVEVAIALTRGMASRFATDQDKKGACLANLGTALRTLGERESGNVRLEEAVTAYRKALEERTRDRFPLNWARTQMGLGNALWNLGQRESGTARLEEAVIAYRNALEEVTRDRVPLDWAMTQMSLGSALLALGLRESGTARLEEAVDAYRNALEEHTRDRVPLAWADTIGSEGSALTTLAERNSDATLAQRALDQLVEAEAVLRDGGHTAWAKTFADRLPEAEALLTRLLETHERE